MAFHHPSVAFWMSSRNEESFSVTFSQRQTDMLGGLALKLRLCIFSKWGRLLDSMETTLEGGEGSYSTSGPPLLTGQYKPCPAFPGLFRQTLGWFPHSGTIAVCDFANLLSPSKAVTLASIFLDHPPAPPIPSAFPQAAVPCLFLLGPGLILGRKDLRTLV